MRKARHKRGGRPRLYGTRERPDHGTPELVMKRIKAVTVVLRADDAPRPPRRRRPPNPALAESPLGILYARGVIGPEAIAAGQRYARSYWAAFGKPLPHIIRLPLPISPEERARAMAIMAGIVDVDEDPMGTWLMARQLLEVGCSGRWVTIADVQDVCVFRMWPVFLDDEAHEREGYGGRTESFRRALERLGEAWPQVAVEA